MKNILRDNINHEIFLHENKANHDHGSRSSSICMYIQLVCMHNFVKRWLMYDS